MSKGKINIWLDDFSRNEQTKGNARAAQQGSGSSSSSSNEKSSSGIAQGTGGSAVDTSYNAAKDNARKSSGINKEGKKQSSFGIDFARKEVSKTGAKGIAYQDGSTAAKSSLTKSLVSGQGVAGAQSSTKMAYNGDNRMSSFTKKRLGAKTKKKRQRNLRTKPKLQDQLQASVSVVRR